MSIESYTKSTSSSGGTTPYITTANGIIHDNTLSESPLTLSHSSISSSQAESRNSSLRDLSGSNQEVLTGRGVKSVVKQDITHQLSSSLVSMKFTGKFPDSSSDLGLENLRWEDELSDEEMERERIEKYKENRRKRYEKALLEQKTKLALSYPKGRVLYCSAAS